MPLPPSKSLLLITDTFQTVLQKIPGQGLGWRSGENQKLFAGTNKELFSLKKHGTE